ncbi:hypothetical protein GCM10010967_13920 [Dyadobacter beijingensis]|uniref:Cycloisomerase n=1 Tax=Dyadobacter beijingensis TaxID=365489 RepID=A0ABQ2HJ57_9BACT|nr:hypothetical protein [Dyadobacter beijingensis]GGM83407.1 hypothetical protein GCM10010967_13920 [Dyadobacter beijingensis]
MSFRKSLVLFIFLVLLNAVQPLRAQSLAPLKEFDVKEAKQAVAVDAQHFYVINNSTITKHSKADGKLVATWDGTREGIVHLNSGVVIKGKMYCANSNYPEIPMTSSVEIFDVKTLTHVGTHSFGIAQHGSLTWLDQRDGHWYIGFAHYAGKEASEGRDVRWTSLVKYDPEWRQVEAWVFPKNLIDLFTPKSNSGGAWGSDGLLYCTGHDRGEVYVLKIPKSGYTLEYIRTLPAPIEGQGIAIDRTVPGKSLLYGIRRSKHAVTVSEIR